MTKKNREIKTEEVAPACLTVKTDPAWFWFYLALVLACAYFTYFRGYEKPVGLFWDENYHIASAAKYLHGVFLMEMHPPLGKLLIAAGEYLFQSNKDLDLSSFLTTNYIKTFPDGYSFQGVRFFPTLFGVFSAGLFFLLLYLLCSNAHLALIFSSLYLFDNALIVHTRSAMLEGPQVFFVLCALCYAVFLFQKSKRLAIREFCLLGIPVGLALAVKVNSAILLLIFPLLFFLQEQVSLANVSPRCRKFFIHGISFTVGILVPLCLVWEIHFSLARNVLNNNYYNISPAYQLILRQRATRNWGNFPVMLRDAYRYFLNYQKGVPRLKGDVADENGSHPVFWPVGKFSISYRWDKTDDGKVKYLRLQCNPVSWAIGGLSVFLATILVGAHYIYRMPVKSKPPFLSIAFFVTLYLCYMLAMFQIDRVMYLYHYFLPLLFSYCLALLIFQYAFGALVQRHDKWVYAGLCLFAVNIFAAFFFFSPFTYHLPLSTQEFLQRSWLSIWRLEPVYW